MTLNDWNSNPAVFLGNLKLATHEEWSSIEAIDRFPEKIEDILVKKIALASRENLFRFLASINLHVKRDVYEMGAANQRFKIRHFGEDMPNFFGEPDGGDLFDRTKISPEEEAFRRSAGVPIPPEDLPRGSGPIPNDDKLKKDKLDFQVTTFLVHMLLQGVAAKDQGFKVIIDRDLKTDLSNPGPYGFPIDFPPNIALNVFYNYWRSLMPVPQEKPSLGRRFLAAVSSWVPFLNRQKPSMNSETQGPTQTRS